MRRFSSQELEMHRLLSSRRELDEYQQRIEQLVVKAPPLPCFSGFHPLFERRKQHIWNVNTTNPGVDTCDEGVGAVGPCAAGWEQTLDQVTGTSDARNEAADGVVIGGVPEHHMEKKGIVDDDPDEEVASAVRDGNMREPFYLAYSEDVVEYFSLTDALKLIKNGRTLVGSTFLIPYPPGFPISVPGQVRCCGLHISFGSLVNCIYLLKRVQSDFFSVAPDDSIIKVVPSLGNVKHYDIAYVGLNGFIPLL